VKLWYFLISRSATAPGRDRCALFFFSGSGRGSGDTIRSGGGGLQGRERSKQGGASLGILATVCFVRAIAAAASDVQCRYAEPCRAWCDCSGECVEWEERSAGRFRMIWLAADEPLVFAYYQWVGNNKYSRKFNSASGCVCFLYQQNIFRSVEKF
jgi:hypothetical protein